MRPCALSSRQRAWLHARRRRCSCVRARRGLCTCAWCDVLAPSGMKSGEGQGFSTPGGRADRPECTSDIELRDRSSGSSTRALQFSSITRRSLCALIPPAVWPKWLPSAVAEFCCGRLVVDLTRARACPRRQGRHSSLHPDCSWHPGSPPPRPTSSRHRDPPQTSSRGRPLWDVRRAPGVDTEAKRDGNAGSVVAFSHSPLLR